jgi:hypothetical protein
MLRGCHVISVTDAYGCILGLLDRSFRIINVKVASLFLDLKNVIQIVSHNHENIVHAAEKFFLAHCSNSSLVS